MSTLPPGITPESAPGELEVIRLVGGPNDGQEITTRTWRDRWNVPYSRPITLADSGLPDKLDPMGVYVAQLRFGHRSRADDGALLFDWAGWR